ncbi:MAG: universal stress protein [Actinomycetota bacterium]|nr:universal stress protein [Actinomycetota bacterium]
MTAHTEYTNARGIVVAVDGSPPSDKAVDWAVREAASRKTPLKVVHVLRPPMVVAWPEMPPAPVSGETPEDQGRAVLATSTERAEKLAAELGGVTVSSEMYSDTIMGTLIDLSKDAELLVVGSRGLGAMGRTVLGSVSSAMVHHAHCPVAVIHDDWDEGASSGAPVVVGIDGSPASETATAIAFDEAARRDVPLVAVHAWSDATAIEYPGVTYATMQNLGEEALGERLAGWHERYPDVEVRRAVVCDRPAHKLLEEAEKAQLVVVGSHGRGGFAGMLLGSVSTKVVHHAQVPVIVARQG